MLNERALELINAEVDGELGPDERAELGSVLAASPEVRAAHEALRRLGDLLEGQPEQDPPPGLAERIVARIRLPERRAAAPAGFSLSRLLAGLQPAQAGLAFAAGLLMTVAVYELAGPDGHEADLSEMVGTTIADPGAGAGAPVSSATISQAGVSGTVSLSDMGSYLVMNFDLEAAAETEVVVELAEAGLSFGGIAHASAGSNADTESFAVSGGTLRVANQGRQHFMVFLRRAEESGLNSRSIDFEVSQAGGKAYRGSLQLGGDGA
jgi:anti-sigma factor RsiW